MAAPADDLNATYSLLVAAAAGGLGVAYFVCVVPSWIGWLGGDRVGQGWRLGRCDDPAKRFEARRLNKPPPPRSVSGIVAHARTIYNSTLLPTVLLGLTVGQIIILFAWLAINVAGLLMQNNLMTNPKRAAHVAIAQLPFVFALGAKNSLTALLGKGYEKLNFLHRFCGRTIVLCAGFHSGMYLFSPTFKLIQPTGPLRLYGICSIGCLLLMGISSLRPLRRLFYQTFLLLHYLGWIGFLICVNLHEPKGIPRLWTFLALGIIATDYLFRLVTARVRTTRIMTERGDFTRLRIEGLDHGWRAGQHVRVRVRRGWLGFESHPFTIANAPSTMFMGRPRGIIIHIHASGDWTRRLRKLTYDNSGLDDFSLFTNADPRPMVAQVAVEGPYGGLAYRDLADAENALIVCGGSGITTGLALLEDAVGRAYQERARVENIVFVWSLRDYEAMHTFSSELNRLADLAKGTPGLAIWMRLHMTGEPPRHGRAKEVKGATVTGARPQLNEVVRLVVNQTIGDEPKNGPCRGGIFVAACGPQGLMDSVRSAVSGVPYSDAVQAGGIVCHCERFDM